MHDKSVRKENIEDDFTKLISTMKPKSQILELTKAIVLDVWQREQNGTQETVQKREERMKELESDIEKCCDKIERTNSERVMSRLEGRVEDMEQELERLQESAKSRKTPGCDFGTATNVVFNFIRNPSKLWDSDEILEQRLVPKLVFAACLPYRKGEGYETPTFSLLFELCRGSENDKSRVVEMPGVEPGSNV